MERQKQEPSSSTRKSSSRRTLSCYPCRRHKIKCDRHVPCLMCIRYQRQDECKQHPAPQSLVRSPHVPHPARIAQGAAKKRQPSDSVEEVQRSPESYLVSQVTESNNSDPQYILRNLFPLPVVLPISEERLLVAPLLRDPIDSQLFWKTQLIAVIPSRSRCDQLVSFYVEHIEWIYHAIHIPSFERQYSTFWSTSVADVDLIWLSLLFTIISATALLVPIGSAEIVTGVKTSKARDLARIWHQCCRQALHAGDFESKPSLMALQVFLVTQLYWLEMKNFEILNS